MAKIKNPLTLIAGGRNFDIFHIEQVINADGTSTINVTDYTNQPTDNYYIAQVVNDGVTSLLIFDLLTNEQVAEIGGII